MEETKKDNRIEFVGFLNEQQVSQLLQSADVLLCPSLWEEPFGRVVLDAYKNAMPVICSNMGALPELVEDQIWHIAIGIRLIFFSNLIGLRKLLLCLKR